MFWRLISMAVEHKHRRTKAGLDTLEPSMSGGGAEKSHPHEVYTTMKAKKISHEDRSFFPPSDSLI